MKANLEKPYVKDIIWNEQDKQFWCYCCQLDASLHMKKSTLKGDCVVVAAGFLGHITRFSSNQLHG